MEGGTCLPPDLAFLPVQELYGSTKRILAHYLDPPTIGTNKSNVLQDWSGLAELMNLDPQEIDFLEHCSNQAECKTMGLLKKWAFASKKSNLGQLWMYLEELERYDIINDENLLKKIRHDVTSYLKRQETQKEADELYAEELKMQTQPIQVPQIDSNHQDVLERRDRMADEFRNVVVRDVLDKDKPPVIFDAFVSFCLEDMEFVQEMLDKVEKKHGLQLCVTPRDLLAGGSKYHVTAKLIADRCRKVILVMSPAFINSPECDFQVKVAVSLSPGAKQKILIPILYRPCAIPLVLQHICAVDYTRVDLADWFWTRLAASLGDSYVSVSKQLSFDESVQLERVGMELLPDGADSDDEDGDGGGAHLLESMRDGQLRKIRPAKVRTVLQPTAASRPPTTTTTAHAPPRSPAQAAPPPRDRQVAPPHDRQAAENDLNKSSVEDSNSFSFVSEHSEAFNVDGACTAAPVSSMTSSHNNHRSSTPAVIVSRATQKHSTGATGYGGHTGQGRHGGHGIRHPLYMPRSDTGIVQHRKTSPISNSFAHNGSRMTSSSSNANRDRGRAANVDDSFKVPAAVAQSSNRKMAAAAVQKTSRDATSRHQEASYADERIDDAAAERSIESSMECETGSQISSANDCGSGAKRNASRDSSSGSSLQPVRYPPQHSGGVDLSMSSQSANASQLSSDYMSLTSLRDDDIRLPGMPPPPQAAGTHAGARRGDGTPEFNHDDYALASLGSVSSSLYHDADHVTGTDAAAEQTAAADRLQLPVNIAALDDLEQSMEDGYDSQTFARMDDSCNSKSPIRSFFPNTAT